MYEPICARTQGADHIKHGIPCEDFGISVVGDNCIVFAMGDGHGDSNCPRSQFGSQKACEIALNKMTSFCSDIRKNLWEVRLLDEGSKEQNALVKQLFTSIVAEWVSEVIKNYENYPLTEAERAGCARYIARYDKGERLEHIYGTTLIAGLLTEKYLLLIQQGDGRCVVFDAEGNPSQPVPWNDKCFANVTTSLCDEDVIQEFRYKVIPMENNPIVACFAGSDGVEDSFLSMDQMESFYRDLLIRTGEIGVRPLETRLQAELGEFSKKGSGDDVTICGFIDSEKAARFTAKFQKDKEIIGIENAIRDRKSRLESMNGMGKMDALQKQHERARFNLENAQREFNQVKAIRDAYLHDLGSLHRYEKKWDKCLSLLDRVLYPSFGNNRNRNLSFDIKDNTDIINSDYDQKEKNLKKAESDFVSVDTAYRELFDRREKLENEIRELENRLYPIHS